MQTLGLKLFYHMRIQKEVCHFVYPQLLLTFFLLEDILIGLLRLRKCTQNTFRMELKQGVSIVRELHVYLSYSSNSVV